VQSDPSSELLPPDLLSDALVQMFGLHVSEFTDKLEEQLSSGQGLQSSSYAVGGGKKAEGLRFTEFLIFARKTREEVCQHLKDSFPGSKEREVSFAEHDLDGDGLISEEELRVVLKGMGYTPLAQNVGEIYQELHKGDSRFLDFNEYFDFMLIFNQREGFRKAVVSELRKVFDRFDSEGTGEISALELAELFRALGYTETLDQIRILVAQVDENNSGKLDFREYMRLMRLSREKELTNILSVFDRYKKKDTGRIHKNAIGLGLKELAYTSLPKDTQYRDIDSLDFDAFVGLVDACRNELVAKEKKKAGFTDDRVEELRVLFDRHDKDKGGDIDTTELLGILKVFDWQPKSREEQQALVQKMMMAKERAAEAGVEEVGGEGAISFWTFVQLARMLEMEYAHAEEERMKKLMEELKFTQKEVEQFREFFLSKKQEYADETANTQETPIDPATLKGLPRDVIRKLIKGLGVAILGDRKPMLDEELSKLGCPEEGLLDFFGFLQLMKWLMETGWMKT